MRSRLLILSVIGCLALFGCNATQQRQGASGVVATYKLRTLTAQVPSEKARVGAVMAAAEDTYTRRGYAIKSNEVTDYKGVIVGVPPRHTDFPKVKFQASDFGDHTLIEVTCDPLGNEELSRSILESVLARLGL